TVMLKDLDYALDPQRRSLFLRIADKFAHDALRKNLAEGARWSIAPQIAAIRGEIEKAMVRPLAPGIFLRGRVDDITPLAIGVHAEALVIDVVATGSAEVEIRSADLRSAVVRPPVGRPSADPRSAPSVAGPEVQRL